MRKLWRYLSAEEFLGAELSRLSCCEMMHRAFQRQSWANPGAVASHHL